VYRVRVQVCMMCFLAIRQSTVQPASHGQLPSSMLINLTFYGLKAPLLRLFGADQRVAAARPSLQHIRHAVKLAAACADGLPDLWSGAFDPSGIGIYYSGERTGRSEQQQRIQRALSPCSRGRHALGVRQAHTPAATAAAAWGHIH
jgi:hypothetical protein